MPEKIQIQERAKRKRNRINMMGMRQPKGTRPNRYIPVEKPVWHPMAFTMPDFSGLFGRLGEMFRPRWKRRLSDEELARKLYPGKH